jgi:glutamate 5-kinase
MKQEIIEKVKKSDLIVIKVGSARVSGARESVNDFLFQLAGDIRQLRNQGKKIVLVSSGAIAQGKTIFSNVFARDIDHTGNLSDKQALAAMGQNQLMNLYESFFSKVNIPIAQILFGKGDIQTSKSHKNLESTFRKLLDWNVLPIVNENDSISTEELNLGDNDLLSALVASLLNANILLILTGVDGFIKEKQVVPYLSDITTEDLSYAMGPSGPGTGGMFTKLSAGKILVDFGINTGILNGNYPNCISRFLSGELNGTWIGDPKLSIKIKRDDDWIKRFYQ